MRLLPDDPYARAQIRALCEHVNSGMQPLQNYRVGFKVQEDYGGDRMKWTHYWNTVGFESLEKKLEKTAGKFAFGDTPTLADAFIFPQVTGSCNRFGIKMEDYPIISRIHKNLLEFQEVKDSLPENQPDYEEPETTEAKE